MTNTLLQKFSIGSWIQLGHPAVAEIMASAGFDWLAIDLEHSTITLREAEDLIRVIDLKGVVPLVRLSSNNNEQIKRIMDAGAHGIIVPMVKSKEDAQSAVSAVKYPPQGHRSVGLARAQGYGARFVEYFEWQRDHSLVIVQIEHIDAVDNLESILTVPGVDAYIVGPYDLSGSLGIPGQFQAPEFIDAMQRILNVSKKLQVPGGVHIVEPDPAELRQRMEEGNRFIAYGMDTRMLDTSCRQGLQAALGKGSP
jgi:2-keto-3-deoxy-L-rhamnonate aldolase RhmA